jgi:PAS domain S-box-containing protein
MISEIPPRELPVERGRWLRHGPKTRTGWVFAGVAAVAWAYAAFTAFVFSHPVLPTTQGDLLAEWAALPVQLAAVALVACLLFRRESLCPRKRLAWWWVLAFTVTSPIASYVWNTGRVDAAGEILGGADLIYLADYWMLTGAFAVWYVRAGGSFRHGRVWLDGLTMIVVLLVGLWSFFVGPSLANGTGRGITVAATSAYSITIVCMMSMAALLCMQLPAFRGRTAVLLLVGAGLADVSWEIMWMASWLTDRDFVGPFYNYGDVLCFAAVCTAVAATQFTRLRPSSAVDEARRLDSFLPALAVLFAIAVVAGSLATTRRADAWILVGLVALCSLLLITRQGSARKEVRALNRQLAKREADARLTELVRRSTDLILVIGADGIVTFASPATEVLLGVPAAEVQGAAVAELFGAEHRAVLGRWLDRIREMPAAHAGTELRVQRGDEAPRVYKLGALNQLANELIGGIVLTVTDVTEQRMLEREVLDAASRERLRLSAEIHDGLGQELVGIAMILQGAAAAKEGDGAEMRRQIYSVVGHINRVVVLARDLARGLSPLGVVRGSLGGALGRLIPDSNTTLSVDLDIDSTFEERVIDDFCADHLYRIAQEAVSNALRHSACTRIGIALRRTDTGLLLEIKDNGTGFGAPGEDHRGLGLRLMEYRARIIGGTLQIHHGRDQGTRVEVFVPFGG